MTTWRFFFGGQDANLLPAAEFDTLEECEKTLQAWRDSEDRKRYHREGVCLPAVTTARVGQDE